MSIERAHPAPRRCPHGVALGRGESGTSTAFCQICRPDCYGWPPTLTEADLHAWEDPHPLLDRVTARREEAGD